jgi:membrane protein
MDYRIYLSVFRDAFRHWQEAKAPRLGAAIAFYAVISLAPLLVLLLALVELVFGSQAAAGQLVKEIQGTVGRPVAEAIQGMLQNTHESGSLTTHTIVGVIVLIFGASGVFVELQDSLNTIWQVTPRPNRVILGVIRERFLSFVLLMCVGFLLLVSLAVTACLAALSRIWSPEAIPGGAWVWQRLNFAVSFVAVSILFALILKVLPDAEIRWRDVWLGAVLTSLLFSVGKFALVLYLEHGNVTTGYGAAGSLVVVLLQVYYSSQIFLFGATWTRAWSDRFGRGAIPAANAASLSACDRAEQGTPTEQEVSTAEQGS